MRSWPPTSTPGLFDIASEQCLPYINMMTMNTSEIVLVQVTNSSDVDKVKSILQSRIDAQVEGGRLVSQRH